MPKKITKNSSTYKKCFDKLPNFLEMHEIHFLSNASLAEIAILGTVLNEEPSTKHLVYEDASNLGKQYSIEKNTVAKEFDITKNIYFEKLKNLSWLELLEKYHKEYTNALLYIGNNACLARIRAKKSIQDSEKVRRQNLLGERDLLPVAEAKDVFQRFCELDFERWKNLPALAHELEGEDIRVMEDILKEHAKKTIRSLQTIKFDE